MDVDLAAVEALYSRNHEDLGNQSAALGWRLREEQQLRFAILTEDVGRGDHVSLIDYGSGFSDLAEFLIADRGQRIRAYVGYELVASMRDVGAARLRDLGINGSLESGPDVVHRADWAFVSGTFNFKGEVSNEDWQRYIEGRLLELFAATDVGLSFNMLSSHVDWQQPNLFYGDPSHFLAFCLSGLSRKVVLRHDYPLYEWSMTVLH